MKSVAKTTIVLLTVFILSSCEDMFDYHTQNCHKVIEMQTTYVGNAYNNSNLAQYQNVYIIKNTRTGLTELKTTRLYHWNERLQFPIENDIYCYFDDRNQFPITTY